MDFDSVLIGFMVGGLVAMVYFNYMNKRLPPRQVLHPLKSRNDVYKITRYICIFPMSRLAYNELRGWELPEDENGNDSGFKVEDYITGHISWLPQEDFEKLQKEVI